MKNKPLIFIAIFGILNYGCSKSSNNPKPTTKNNSTIKISLVSGNGQNAQIGYPLPDSIYVKVTNNGNAASGYAVQFIGSGCNEDLVANISTKSDGTAAYSWAMAGNGGAQTLNAVVVQNGQRIDSVAANATASTVLVNPAKSACTPNIVITNKVITGIAEHFVRLSTGRLLACFDVITSIRYSDDNGATWNPLKGFGASNWVTQLAVTPQNGIFAATATAGIFYSADAGNNWKNVSPPGFNMQNGVYDMNYTNSGKLIVLSALTNVYITANQGGSWTASNGTGLNAGTSYSNPVELSNGDIYVVSLSSVLFKSTDGGQNWAAQNNKLDVDVTAIYVDDNGYFYEASSTPASSQDVIAVSKDNGVTFNNLVSYMVPTYQPFIEDIGIQPDGKFYFGLLSTSIVQETSGGTLNTMVSNNVSPFAPYIATTNQVFVYGSYQGVFYLLQ
jgi:photosystem II stability/assembly factor-like uncharacterized protein